MRYKILISSRSSLILKRILKHFWVDFDYFMNIFVYFTFISLLLQPSLVNILKNFFMKSGYIFTYSFKHSFLDNIIDLFILRYDYAFSDSKVRFSMIINKWSLMRICNDPHLSLYQGFRSTHVPILKAWN